MKQNEEITYEQLLDKLRSMHPMPTRQEEMVEQIMKSVSNLPARKRGKIVEITAWVSILAAACLALLLVMEHTLPVSQQGGQPVVLLTEIRPIPTQELFLSRSLPEDGEEQVTHALIHKIISDKRNEKMNKERIQSIILSAKETLKQ